ncbi:cupredoxin domain-containing protein [Paenibacillus soyae]|uniref:Plastocyanin/azurin family copper-binding protein n=1 Tax=Paenibacillus soyae TaxID=2969249 RepID=A0A9X2S9A7_9BACL|nr:plastocyanin/azurin family copper-binding protein [Paenibacillus soyae]MCR2804935.1 plastocyanin/azurin family copper-binding protein [Paenibacillus soyae]
MLRRSRMMTLLPLVLISLVLLSACGLNSNEPAELQANSTSASETASPEATPDASDEAVQEQDGMTETPKETEAPADTPETAAEPTPSPTPKATASPKAEPAVEAHEGGHSSGKDGHVAEGGQTSRTTASPKPTAKATSPAENAASEKPAGEVHLVEIVNFAFSPAELTIKAGDSVKFINKDEIGHSATADDKSFDTGMLELDDAKEVAFDKEGEFSYYCLPHPGMKGKIIVEKE